MEMDGHESDLEGSVSNNDEELSDIHDDDSDDHMSRVREDANDADILSKLKQQVRNMERNEEHAQNQTPPTPHENPPGLSPFPHQFSLPLPFPFPHPAAAAFLPPVSGGHVPSYPAPPPHNSSGSSHSSESSNSSQQQTWSFEEQFKQVRQLYEISDDPKRKEFLDDLFSYMQKRGTPINRLPIMAKSVLDLYELYNLVIARGGLVDVINKKLWQEIIKGLHLPSSITSAAFTLRTQYMKYLYPYECEKRRLSTPSELQAAIDGNRREGRRSSYGTYPELMQRSPGPTHPSQMSPLSLASQLRPQINGNGHLHHPVLHPSLGQPPLPAGPIPGITSEFEARMVEYVKLLNKEFRTSATTPPTIRQGSNSPPSSTSPREAFSAMEMSRLTLWNLYNNNHHPPSTPEPQKEALDLGVKEQQQQQQQARQLQAQQQERQSPQVKREPPEPVTNGPPAKKLLSEEEELEDEEEGMKVSGAAHIKISSRKDGKESENSLAVSMDINGIMYQGVLFAQNSTRSRSS